MCDERNVTLVSAQAETRLAVQNIVWEVRLRKFVSVSDSATTFYYHFGYDLLPGLNRSNLPTDDRSTDHSVCTRTSPGSNDRKGSGCCACPIASVQLAPNPRIIDRDECTEPVSATAVFDVNV